MPSIVPHSAGDRFVFIDTRSDDQMAHVDHRLDHKGFFLFHLDMHWPTLTGDRLAAGQSMLLLTHGG